MLLSFNPHTHEGCDYRTFNVRNCSLSFNPHTHEGCDFAAASEPCFAIVSIHTPTKGVTQNQNDYESVHHKFQSTHPRRVWLIRSCWLSVCIKFQSTHPRRVWLRSAQMEELSNQFQSTHPRRVWRLVVNRGLMRIVFQSTHPRRVWLVDTMAL